MGNAILSNSIFSNAALGIDLRRLGAAGVTTNDPGDSDAGPNNLQNFPVLTSATGGGGSTSIDGTLNSSPSTTFTVQFFSNSLCDPSGFGEGETFIGSDSLTTDASGDVNFSTNLPGAVPAGQFITATATDPVDNTSEFSACTAVSSTSIVVTNTDDSGMGSLRAAIDEANLTVGADLIEFDIPGGGLQTIQPLSALPSISDPVTIDGTTQPGFGGAPIIELDGTLSPSGVNGLHITAGNSTVRGLAINQFGGNGILIETGDGNLVVGNFIGTDPTGTIELGNGFNAIHIVNSDDNTIGGPGPDARNLLSGSGRDGVRIQGGPTATGNVVQGNFIGTDVTGTVSFSNDIGILITAGAQNNVIGTDGSGVDDGTEGNLISGNRRSGVRIQSLSVATYQNVVAGNLIGTDASGSLSVPNGNWGVLIIDGAKFNRIGTNSDSISDTAERNIISGNAKDGVRIVDISSAVGASDNLVAGNYIGLGADGSSALSNSWAGIQILNAPSNIVGGTASGAGNLISGNGTEGVRITGSGAVGNLVKGNFIGTDAAGNVSLGNSGNGVSVDFGAANNLIGGLEPGARNVISGNDGGGVGISETGTTQNVVQGNLIGTDVTGTAPLGNTGTGIFITDGPTETLVGGTDAGAANVISDNGAAGVVLDGPGVTGNVVAGNFIGTDIDGTSAMPNFVAGVWIVNGATDNTIGGSTPAARNVISGNDGNGISILVEPPNFLPPGGNWIQGNFIGTDVTGTLQLGNVLAGVLIVESPDNTVESNTIAFNSGDGVYMEGAKATGNTITQNSIFDNFFKGLENFGGGNSELAPPVITGMFGDRIEGAAPANSLVEVFADNAEEGRTYLGETLTDGAGQFVCLEGPCVAAFGGPNLTATATDSFRNTSEFSLAVPWAPDTCEFNNSFEEACDVAGELSFSLNSSGSFQSWVSGPGDVDWFTFDLPAGIEPGTLLTFDLAGELGDPLPANFDLAIFAELEEDSIGASPIQGVPIQGVPIQGVPIQGVPIQGVPIQGVPIQGVRTEAVPIQGVPIQGVPIQGVPIQGVPIQGVPIQGVPIQGVPIQGVGFHQGTQVEQVSTLFRGGMTGTYFVLVWSSTGEYSSGVSDSPYEVTVSADEVSVAGCTTPLYGVASPDLDDVTAPVDYIGDPLTLIILNRVRMASHYTPEDLDSLQITLNELAIASNLPVKGMFVDLADVSAVMNPTDPLANGRLQAAYASWDANGCDPVEANAVTLEIKAVINQVLADNPSVIQLVFVGNDLIVPHRRVPDGVIRTVNNAAIPNEFDYQSEDEFANRIGVVEVDISESPTYATLRLQYYLSDDFYGDPRPKFEGLDRELSIPEYPIGRLVELPGEIESYVQVFVDHLGELDVRTSPTPTSLTTGYSFIEDAANEINASLAGITATTALISPDWTEASFTGAYSSGGDAPDVTSANAHFDHFRFAPPVGAGEVELVTTGEIGNAPPTDLSATLFFSVGCHVGFNFWDSDASNPVDSGRIDWAQFFVGEGATLIGSWGYAYGDDALIAYTEELMLKFANRLGLESPGLAMVEAKKDYFLNQAILDPVHEKILMQTIFYGLPMWQLPSNPYIPATGLDESHTTEPSNGLTVADYVVTVDNTKRPRVSTDHGDYYSLAGETQAAVHRPVQPQGNIDVGIVPAKVAHGVLFTGGTYIDAPDFDPVITTPSWTLGVPEFQFLYEGWDPARFWSLAQIERSDGSFDERLAIVVGQFLIDEAESLSTEETVGIQRLYNSLNFEIIYNTAAAEFEPPIITGVDAGVESNPGTFFSVEAEDASGIVQVLVTYTETDGGSSWQSKELALNPSTGSWEGTIPTTDPIHFFIQALDAAGNVGMFAGNGYFAPVAVSVSGPAQVTVGEVASFTATLPSGLTDENVLWDFGDGAVEEGEVAVDHTYSKPGSYSIQVRVVDREGNLGAATTTIAVSSAYGTLEQLGSSIQSLPDEALKSPSEKLRQDLLDKLANVEGQIARGEFNGAIQKLENDILKKMDGCGGTLDDPDKNDWIVDCNEQLALRALISDLIGDLTALR